MAIERANSRKKVTWLSILGLVTIPALIAGGLLWANWNPQERLKTVDAAIVNLDEAATLNGSPVLLGRQLAAGLMDSSSPTSDMNFRWHLETADGAKSGIADGSYVASITIPANFSAAATSFSGDAADATSAQIEVTTSSATALADPTVAQAISQAAVGTLNSTLTTSYLKNVYVGFNTLSTKLSDMSSGASSLASAGAQVDSGTQSLASGLAKANSGSAALESGASSLASGATTLASGATVLASNGVTLASSGVKLQSGILSYTQAISGTSSSPGLAAAASGLATGVKTALGDAATCPAATSQAGVAAINATASQLATAGIPLTQPQQAALQQTGEKLACGVYSQTVTGVLTTADPSTGYTISSLANTVAGGLEQLSTSATSSGGLNDSVTGFTNGVTSYTKGVSSIATGVKGLSSGASSLSSGVLGLSSGLSSASFGASQLTTGTSKLADGLNSFSSGVAAGASSAPTYSESERNNLSTVVATPVTLAGATTSTIFGAYSAAGLLIILALWIGAIATFLVVRPVTRRAVQSSKSSIALLGQGLWPAAVISVGATALLTAIAASVLTLSAGTIVTLAFFTLASALVFSVVNYALVAAFGGIGRFIAVAMGVLGAATMLISGSPEFFQVAAGFSPLTPAIRGFAAIASGGIGVGSACAALIAWLALGLVLGLIAVSMRRQARPGVLESM